MAIKPPELTTITNRTIMLVVGRDSSRRIPATSCKQFTMSLFEFISYIIYFTHRWFSFRECWLFYPTYFVDVHNGWLKLMWTHVDMGRQILLKLCGRRKWMSPSSACMCVADAARCLPRRLMQVQNRQRRRGRHHTSTISADAVYHSNFYVVRRDCGPDIVFGSTCIFVSY